MPGPDSVNRYLSGPGSLEVGHVNGAIHQGLLFARVILGFFESGNRNISLVMTDIYIAGWCHYVPYRRQPSSE